MATYTPDQYQRRARALANELRKAARRSTGDAAQFMARTAQGMAPKKSGALRAGIKARPVKDAEWEISSTVPGDFPYQFWVNQTAPYRTLHFPKGGFIPAHRNYYGVTTRAFPRGSSVVYGDGSHVATGTPRFWHLSFLKTSKLFGRVSRVNVQKALTARTI